MKNKENQLNENVLANRMSATAMNVYRKDDEEPATEGSGTDESGDEKPVGGSTGQVPPKK